MAEPKDPKEEEDQVTAAYENISKKLESLRKGKEVDEKDDSEEEIGKEHEEEGFDDEEDPLDKEDVDETDEKDSKEDDDIEEPIAPLPGTDDEEVDLEDEKPISRRDLEDEGVKDPEDNGTAVADDEVEDEPKETFRPEIRKPLHTDQPEDMDDLVEDRPTPTPARFNEDPIEDFDIPHIKPSNHSDQSMPRDFSTKPAYADVSFTQRGSNDNDPSSFFNRHQSQPPSRKANKWSLLVLVLIGIGVIGFTVYLLKNGLPGSSTPSPSPSPEASVEPSPTPSPSPELDRSKFKIRVLNGTTKAGMAASVSGKLKDLGYGTDKTGNAPKQDYKATQIKVKASATGLSDQLVKDLSADFPNASSAGELKDTDTADGEVIIGAQ